MKGNELYAFGLASLLVALAFWAGDLGVLVFMHIYGGALIACCSPDRRPK